MNLVLTYHRVIADEDPIPGPFAFRRSEFDSQLGMVIDAWRKRPADVPLFNEQLTINAAAPAVVITFDDGTEGHFLHAAPVLEARGLRGIFYVSTALLGANGYVTTDQCKELLARGHFVESHGHEHVSLLSLPSEDRRRQLEQSCRILKAVGGGGLRSLAAVGGDFDREVIADVEAVGLRSLRTLRWGYNRKPGAFLWESVNINRGLGRNAFKAMTEPRAIMAKCLIQKAKDLLKQPPIRGAYRTMLKRISR